MKTFTEVVETQLKSKKLNVVKLSKIINVSTSYLYNLLDGKRRWNEGMMNKCCEPLGISIEYKIKSRRNCNTEI